MDGKREISSIFELYVLPYEDLQAILGQDVGEVYSINIVAQKLPEDGKRVLWISRSADIEVGAYTEKYGRVDLLSNLSFGDDSLFRSTSSFHFWLDVENPEIFSHCFKKIKFKEMNHADPVLSQVSDAFFDMVGRVLQYLGPYNEPPINQKILLVDHKGEQHIGYYLLHSDKPATVRYCDVDGEVSADAFIMWSDIELEGLERLLKAAIDNSAGQVFS